MSSKNKIRIMHVVQSEGYGVTVYVDMLLQNFDRNKFEQILVASTYYEKEKYERVVDAFETVSMGRNVNLMTDFCAMCQVRKLIIHYRPDVVYCHSSKAGFIGRLAGFGLKVRMIYNPHGWAHNMNVSGLKKRVYKTVEMGLAFLANRIVVISRYEQKQAKGICKQSKIAIIYNGIDINLYDKRGNNFTKRRAELGIPENAFVIGMVARISYQKAQDSLVKAAHFIKNEIPNAFFVLVGGWSDEIQIEDEIEKLGLTDSFLITGEVPCAMEYIDLFNIATLLSRWEGFGLVLAEYMLAGKPIVATKVGAIPELVINEVNGLLVQVDDISEIAQACQRLYADPDLRKRMVSNGLDIVRKKFDIKRVVAEHEQLFFNVLQK